jgi:hypothetical protein
VRLLNDTSDVDVGPAAVIVLTLLVALTLPADAVGLEGVVVETVGITKSTDFVGQWQVCGSCLGGRGRYDAIDAAVPTEELGVLTSDGIPLSVAVDVRFGRGRLRLVVSVPGRAE